MPLDQLGRGHAVGRGRGIYVRHLMVIEHNCFNLQFINLETRKTRKMVYSLNQGYE